MISKLAETELILLDLLSESEYPDQNQLCIDGKIAKSTASKAVKRLELAYLVKKMKRGKYNHIKINSNKKSEIKRILTIWEKFNNDLKDKNKVIIRIHDYEVYASCSVLSNYDKQFYNKYCPNNRVGVRRVVEGVGSANINIRQIDSENNSIQIFISSYYLVLPIDVNSQEIDNQINIMNNRLFNCLCELLASEGIIIGKYYTIREGSAALIDDWLSQLAVRYGIKNKNIDQSHYLIDEFEVHGANIPEQIHKVITLRKLILESKISESELASYIIEIQKQNDKIIS